MNKDLIKVHNKILSGEINVKDISDKDLAGLLKRHLYNPVDTLSYPNSDVYFKACDEKRQRDIDTAKKKVTFNEAFDILKKKSAKIDKNFF